MIEEAKIMVTVVMLCYNHEKYIKNAIESVINQDTDYRFEVIIHDDASTDNSASIIREYEKKYPNLIKAIYQTENKYSRHIRIFETYIRPLIKGKYIAKCECDDYWCSKQKLQKQVLILENNPQYVGCTHNCNIVDDNNVFLGNSYTVYHYCRTHVFDIKRFECGLFPGQLAAIMYRASAELFTSEKQKQDFLSIRCQGDQKKDLDLLLRGNIYYLEDVLSSHRVVSNKGSSWTARIHDKDMALYIFCASRDLRHYAKKYYNYILHNHYVTFHRGLHIILQAAKGNKQSKEDFELLGKEIGSKGKAVLYVIIMGIRSVPFFIIQKVMKNKYDYI